MHAHILFSVAERLLHTLCEHACILLLPSDLRRRCGDVTTVVAGKRMLRKRRLCEGTPRETETPGVAGARECPCAKNGGLCATAQQERACGNNVLYTRHIWTHACIHSCIHACVHSCVHACMHSCTRTCMHAYVYDVCMRKQRGEKSGARPEAKIEKITQSLTDSKKEMDEAARRRKLRRCRTCERLFDHPELACMGGGTGS